MSFTFNGREILTDEEGFLKNQNDWSLELMEEMSRKDGLVLNEDHRIIIRAVKDYFEEYATTPAIRVLIKYLKTTGHADLASSITLAKLFPAGAAKSAAKYAGLPKPVKCV